MPSTLFSGKTPEVGVRRIVLNNSENQGEFTSNITCVMVDKGNNINLSYRDVFDFAGNSFIYVIQSTNPESSEILSNKLASVENRIFNLNQESRSIDEAISRCGISGITMKKVSLQEFKNSGNTVGAGNLSSFDGAIDSSRHRISYELPRFEIPTQNGIVHLCYYTFCHLDIPSLEVSMGITLNDSEVLSGLAAVGSTLKKDVVIHNSEIKKFGTIYMDMAGNTYFGQKESVGSEWFKLGTKQRLEPIRVPNGKVVDMRALSMPELDIEEGALVHNAELNERLEIARREKLAKRYENARKMNRIMLDYDSSGGSQRKILGEIMRKSDFGRHADFRAELLHTTSASGEARLIFTIDWEQCIKENSAFNMYFENLTPAQYSRVLRNSAIKCLKFYRRRVTPDYVTTENIPVTQESINRFGFPGGYKEFDSNETPVLLCKSESYSGARLNLNRRVVDGRLMGEISEIAIDWEDLDATEEAKLRSFAVTDFDIKTLNSGQYQYFIEMDIEDGMRFLIKALSFDLRSSIRDLEAFVELSSIPEFSESSESFVERKMLSANDVSRVSYGNYNFDTEEFSDRYIEAVLPQYSEILILAARRYVAIMRLLFGSKSDNVLNVNFDSVLKKINPGSGARLEDMRTQLDMFKHVNEILNKRVISSSRSVVDTSSAPSRTRTASPDGHMFKIVKYFRNTISRNNVLSFGAHYFPPPMSLSSHPGLKVYDTRNRIEREYSKYAITYQENTSNQIGPFLTPVGYSSKNSKKIGQAEEENKGEFRTPRASPSEILEFVEVKEPNKETSFDRSEEDLRILENQSVIGAERIDTKMTKSLNSFKSSMSVLFSSGISIESSSDKKSNKSDSNSNNALSVSELLNIKESIDGSGLNKQLDDKEESMEQISQKDVESISIFASRMAGKLPTNLSDDFSQIISSPSLNSITTAINREEEVAMNLPPQIRMAALMGSKSRSLPGVLSSGVFSDYVHGMLVRIEEKSSFLPGISGISNRRDTEQTSGEDYIVHSPRTSRTSQSASRRIGKYKICKLVLYQNDSLGFGKSRVAKNATIYDEYFLVEV